MTIPSAVRRVLLADNPISRVALAGYRTTLVACYYFPKLMLVPGWLFSSREITNFTYDLTEQNRVHLAGTISAVIGVSECQIENFLAEPGNDAELLTHIASATRVSSLRAISDKIPRFGRRLEWYVFALLIETGVDKGLGSVLLCAALLRNKCEGHEGFYYGTDINREAGFLLSGSGHKSEKFCMAIPLSRSAAFRSR